MATRRIFISVAEDSADIHAAALVRATRQLLPDAYFYGMTGPRLRRLGVDTCFDFTSHAAMLSGVLSLIGKARAALRAIQAAWDRQPPDLVILLDSPELHLPVARLARKRGVRVLYYIAPQTWASRAYRNRRIARDVDRLACILPFEQAYFRRNLIHADYVGHPLFETLATEQPQDAVVSKLRSGNAPVVAILPGSRRHVIDTMLPLQLEVIRKLRAAGTVVTPVISAMSADRVSQIRKHIHASGFPAEVVVADNASLLTAADVVLVSSGTATLHVAHYRKPMVVMYDAGPALRLPYRLAGRFVLKLPHLSLVNILAGARVVPEFMPFIRDTAPIATVAGQLLADADWRQSMVGELDRLLTPLEASRASAVVAEMAARLSAK